MALIRNIHQRRRSAQIVKAIAAMCRDLDTRVVVEGVECAEELHVLEDLGITLMQGYFFAKPMFEGMPEVAWFDKNSTVPPKSPALPGMPVLTGLNQMSV